jgi:protein-S-isoprenylcysteine O-methyltransferase Ste14
VTVEAESNAHSGRVVVANLVLAAWLLADAVRAFIVVQDIAFDVVEIVGALALISAAMFVLLRPAPLAQDLRVSSIAIAMGAAFVPIALQMLSSPALRGGSFLIFVEASAAVILTLSILYLGPRFSLVPQYRSLVADGPYAVVRHPIYASYLLFDGALALESANWVSGGLWLAEAVLLLLRSQREEQLLETCDPTYRAYLARVRYRFVPLVV